jgi:hypothetical protein
MGAGSFRIISSAESATYNLTNYILTANDDKLFDGGLFSDLTKELDRVKYTCDILLAKFEYYGING